MSELSELVEVAQVEALDFQELEALELDAVRVLCAELVPLLKHADRSGISQYENELPWRWRRYGRKHKTIWLHKDWTTFGNAHRMLYISDTSELLVLSCFNRKYHVQAWTPRVGSFTTVQVLEFLAATRAFIRARLPAVQQEYQARRAKLEQLLASE